MLGHTVIDKIVQYTAHWSISILHINTKLLVYTVMTVRFLSLVKLVFIHALLCTVRFMMPQVRPSVCLSLFGNVSKVQNC